MTIFSQRVKQLRQERKLTRAQLAEALGVAEKTVYRWETYVKNVSLTTLIKLAFFFDVSLEYLTGRSGDKKLPNKRPNS